MRFLIPPGQHETRIVDAVVLMQVCQEQMSRIRRLAPRFQIATLRSGAMIEQDRVVADRDQIAGARTFQQRRRYTSPQP